jgi:uncharacterized membrane protein YqiK
MDLVPFHPPVIAATGGVPVAPIVLGALALLVVVLVLRFLTKSFNSIGPSEVGLVTKRVGKKLEGDQLIAFAGEAGYQAELLMPGLRFKLWPIYSVDTYAWVQVPPDNIGLVVAQSGAALPSGAMSAIYKPEFGNFGDLSVFLENGGQRGVQRHVLPPGTTAPLHPVAFVVLTPNDTFGEIVSAATEAAIANISRDRLRVLHIAPQAGQDVVGVVTALEGPDPGAFASRIGGFEDIAELVANDASDSEIINKVLESKNRIHNSYQDFQAFLDAGGRNGLQHDTLSYGAYVLNPLLVQVELVLMLVVSQGEVAVIKSYLGLPTEDTSGEEFKFGSIVKPGHQGIWSESLRTGKFSLNPRIYGSEIVPTSILTLNWANVSSEAHDLDKQLSPISAKSKEAFDFSIDLQVQIHVPDTMAPKVISMVGTIANLVNEVLQSAVGNYFRNKLQSLGATEFIQKRDEVQAQAQEYIHEYLSAYNVETRGVYIQDVIFPQDLVDVLTQREIAAQETATFENQRIAQEARIELEQQRGVADMQGELAAARVSVDIKTAEADAAVAQAEGEGKVVERLGTADAARITAVGIAEATAVEKKGVAQAEGFKAQQEAIGAEQTALVAALHEIGTGGVKITPDFLVGEGAGILGGLGALAMLKLSGSGPVQPVLEPVLASPDIEAPIELGDGDTPSDAG